MRIEFIDYNIRKKGKLIKNTKKVHIWDFRIEDKTFEIELSESFISKKIRVSICNVNIISKNITESEKNEGIMFIHKNINYKIKKNESKNFDLFVGGKKFIIGEIKQIYENGKFETKKENEEFKIKYKKKNKQSKKKNGVGYFTVQGGRQDILNELNNRKKSLEKYKNKSLKKENKVTDNKVINFEFNINMKGSFFSNLKKNEEKVIIKNNFEEKEKKDDFSLRLKKSYLTNYEKNFKDKSKNIYLENKNQQFIQIKNNLNFNNSNFINFNEISKKKENKIDFNTPKKTLEKKRINFSDSNFKKKKKFQDIIDSTEKKRTKSVFNEKNFFSVKYSKKRFSQIGQNYKIEKVNKVYNTEISNNISKNLKNKKYNTNNFSSVTSKRNQNKNQIANFNSKPNIIKKNNILRKTNIFITLKKKLKNVRTKIEDKKENKKNNNNIKNKKKKNKKKMEISFSEESKKKNNKKKEISFSEIPNKKNEKNKYDFLNKDFIDTFDCAKDITEDMKKNQKTPFDEEEDFNFFKLDDKNDIQTPFDTFDFK